MSRLADKVAFVTGGGAGIGAVCSRRLADDGAFVVVTNLELRPPEATASEIRASGEDAERLAVDVSNHAAVEVAVDEVVRRHGALHVAVNNAGIGGPPALLHEYPVDSWRHVLSVNLDGVFYSMRAQLRHMSESNHGSIVNIGSMFFVKARTLVSAYVAAKHAVLGLIRVAALEYAEAGFRINVVGPGRVATPMVADQDEEAIAKLVAEVPVKRQARPEEIAAVVAWLASDDAAYVTGAFYATDGGFAAQ